MTPQHGSKDSFLIRQQVVMFAFFVLCHFQRSNRFTHGVSNFFSSLIVRNFEPLMGPRIEFEKSCIVVVMDRINDPIEDSRFFKFRLGGSVFSDKSSYDFAKINVAGTIVTAFPASTHHITCQRFKVRSQIGSMGPSGKGVQYSICHRNLELFGTQQEG